MTFNIGDKAIFQNPNPDFAVDGSDPDPLNGHEVTITGVNELYTLVFGFNVYDFEFEAILDGEGEEYSTATMPEAFLTLVGEPTPPLFNPGDKVIFQHSNPDTEDPRNGTVGTVTGETGQSAAFSNFIQIEWEDEVFGLAFPTELTLVAEEVAV